MYKREKQQSWNKKNILNNLFNLFLNNTEIFKLNIEIVLKDISKGKSEIKKKKVK